MHSSLLYAKHQDCLQIVATLAKLGLNFTHRRWPTPLQPSASTTCVSKGRRRAWNSCISTFTYSGLAALKMYELKVNFVAPGGGGISFCNCSLWSFGSCWNCEVVEVWHVSPSDIHHQRHAFSSKSLIPCSRSNKPGPSDQVDLYKWEWVAHQDSSHLVMDTLRLQKYPIKSRQWHNLLSTSIFASPFFSKVSNFSSSRLPLLEAI